MPVLEVGPGAGRYEFRPLARVNETPVFFDISPPRDDLKEYMWVVGDAHMLPFRSECFDKVYASHVIEHLDDPLRFLREARRVLRLGGTLHLKTPNFLSYNARADPDHKHVFTVFSLRRFLSKAGFSFSFDYNAGSLIKPRKLAKLLTYLINFFTDELSVTARSQSMITDAMQPAEENSEKPREPSQQSTS